MGRREYFHCEIIEDFSVRRKLLNTRDCKTFREFDVIAAGDNLVIVNETKSTPRTEYIDDFARVPGTLFDYLPQYRGYRVIPISSSLYLDEETVRYLTGKKLYAMGMKDDTMVILNPGLERETSTAR